LILKFLFYVKELVGVMHGPCLVFVLGAVVVNGYSQVKNGKQFFIF